MHDLRGLDWVHLKAVQAVARLGSVQAAAGSLHVSPSQVSRYLHAAGRLLGAPLFVRSGPVLSLSPAGEGLLPLIDRVLEDVEALASLGPEIAQGRTGQLRLGYTPYTALTALGPVVAACRARLPSIELLLRVESDDVLEAMLVDGRVDAALLNPPFRSLGLQSVPLGFDPFALAVSDSLDLPDPVRPDHEALWRVWVAPPLARPGSWLAVQDRCRDLGLRPPFQSSVDDAQGRIALALDGRSGAWVTAVRSRLAPPGIRIVGIEGFEDMGYATVLATRPPAPPAAQALVEVVGSSREVASSPKADPPLPR